MKDENINVERALEISRLVHDLCKDVPHDIGLTIEKIIYKYENNLSTNYPQNNWM